MAMKVLMQVMCLAALAAAEEVQQKQEEAKASQFPFQVPASADPNMMVPNWKKIFGSSAEGAHAAQGNHQKQANPAAYGWHQSQQKKHQKANKVQAVEKVEKSAESFKKSTLKSKKVEQEEQAENFPTVEEMEEQAGLAETALKNKATESAEDQEYNAELAKSQAAMGVENLRKYADQAKTEASVTGGVHLQNYKVKKVEHRPTHNLPLCRGRQYVEGSWKLLAEAPAKTFKCCSWDEGPGYWKRDSTKCMGASRKVNNGPAGNKFISIGGHGCMCDSNHDAVSKREMHTWQPENCSMPAFNANSFCESIGNGKIMIFGDSQMQQASATLMNMVIGGHRADKPHCTPQISFRLSDYLIGAPDERGEVAEFDKYDADIYIIGLGAWVHNRKKYSDILDIVKGKIEKRMAQPNPPKFLWKTVSGAGCGQINKIAVEHHDPSYTYELFPTYDAMAREKLEPLGVKFLDMSPLYLRGDAHPVGQKDCLHFCAPGPVDIFPRVLHHVLQEDMFTAEDNFGTIL